MKTVSKIILYSFILFIGHTTWSQQATIDSLKRVIRVTKTDTAKANIYNHLAFEYKESNPDTTFYYAKKAFYNWPRATSYYKNMIFASAKMKDTAEATKAFKTYIKYRDSGEGWNQYILGLIEINQTPIAVTRALLDTAVSRFPADSAIFVKTKSFFYHKQLQ